MKKLVLVLSHLLCALLAAALTLTLIRTRNVQVAGASKLAQLSDLIEQEFIGEAERTDWEDAAADAMVRSLGDRWSYYIPADEYENYKQSMANAYVGIGVTVSSTPVDDGYEILAVEKGGPAEQAGLLAGDILTSADGTDLRGLSLSELSSAMRGEEGSYVNLSIKRGTSTLEMRVERKHFAVAVATCQMLPNSVGLVTIKNFDSRCADETIAAIESLREQGAKALIFDVRNNPGGYADELVCVLDYLLPEGPLFRTLDYTGREETRSSDASCVELPMVVLINGESYSAAEFFGAALRDYDAAKLVGEQTCGKGYFQIVRQLDDGSAVGLSIGKYFTPKGESLAGIGLTPDVAVPVDEQTAIAIRVGTLPAQDDPQIQAALELLNAA